MADPYCTVAEADVYLALDLDNWIALSTAEKEDALFWGRVYIDGMWTCTDENGDAYDDTTAPDALKRANAIAANAHSQGKIYSSETEVSEVRVKAGSVESAKKFAVPTSSTVDVPEIAQIKGLLKDVCSGGFGSVELNRV